MHICVCMYVCMYVCMCLLLLYVVLFLCGRYDRPESEIEKYIEKMTDMEEKYEVRSYIHTW